MTRIYLQKTILHYLINWWQPISIHITNLLGDGKQKKTIAVLDGARAIACLSILLFHMYVALRDFHIWSPLHEGGTLFAAFVLFGQCGVQLFFVLSGLLLFLPYARALLFNTPWPSLKQFYLKRAFRIMPAYYIALFLLIALAHQEYMKPDHLERLWLFLTFRMDFPSTFQQLNGPFWTLAVEAQFYVLLPFLALGMRFIVRQRSPHHRLISLSLCLLILVLWGFFTIYWKTHPQIDPFIPSDIKFFKNYLVGGGGKSLDVFAMGMLVATLYIYLQQFKPEHLSRLMLQKISSFIFLIGLAIIIWMSLWHLYIWYFNYALHTLDPIRKWLVYNWEQLQDIGYALGFGLCIFALLQGPRFLKRPFELPPLRWFGSISYSLYIWHVPLINFFMLSILKYLKNHNFSNNKITIFFYCWVIFIIVPFAACSYLWIEKTWIQFGERMHKRKEEQPQIAISPQFFSIDQTLRQKTGE